MLNVRVIHLVKVLINELFLGKSAHYHGVKIKSINKSNSGRDGEIH